MVDVVVPITGWGYDPWGTDGWESDPSIPFATGSVGSVGVSGGATVSM
jgi:hypothetical protein